MQDAGCITIVILRPVLFPILFPSPPFCTAFFYTSQILLVSHQSCGFLFSFLAADGSKAPPLINPISKSQTCFLL